jgi:uncharacterized protein YbjT (DUF2867 family)
MGPLRRSVFLAGGSGYMGRALAKALVQRGHHVRALVRPGSEGNLPGGCEIVHGDALRSETYRLHVASSDTFVHLVGVAHPNPKKAAQFRSIDLQSCVEAVKAARTGCIGHFIYLSVARPAPIMQEYQAARAQGEQVIAQSGMAATFVRPWYVLGPGHRWPTVLIPLYALARLYPGTREGAERLALVTLEQMVRTLAWSVENPADELRVLESRHIKQGHGDARELRQAASA